MSLQTPEKIRSLQRKLYCKAKAEPAFRFYVLYDKIYRTDILRHAYALARANAGAAGVDEETFAQIEASGLERWLAGLRRERLGDPRAVPGFRCTFRSDMPPSTTPGSSNIDKFQSSDVDIGLRRVLSGSALPRPRNPFHAGLEFRGFSGSHFATACQIARSPARI